MCGRYTFNPDESFYDRYEVKEYLASPLKPSFNVAPTQHMPVVVRNSPNRVEMMRWGLIPFWAKDEKIGYKMINARAETVSIKPSFKRSLASQRCLVPATGFYEWKRTADGKIPHLIHLKDQFHFSFAGLYDTWRDAQGQEVKTYTIITTSPNELMAPIHDRMPVILDEEEEDTWLDKDTPLDNLLEFLDPYPADKMESYPVSPLVNSPRNNTPALIRPVTS